VSYRRDTIHVLVRFHWSWSTYDNTSPILHCPPESFTLSSLTWSVHLLLDLSTGNFMLHLFMVPSKTFCCHPFMVHVHTIDSMISPHFSPHFLLIIPSTFCWCFVFGCYPS
jgi:hypothetical protein